MAEENYTGKQQKLKIRQLIDDLSSGNELKISTAIKSLETNGDASVLEPMVSILLSDISSKNKAEVLEFLASLKDSSAIDEIMRLIADEKYLPIRKELLASIWNSKLDYSYFLPEFVEIACEGDFMEALECLTIIENLQNKFEERHILESKLHLKDYFENEEEKEPKKAQIISEIAILIKDFDSMDEDDDIDFFND